MPVPGVRPGSQGHVTVAQGPRAQSRAPVHSRPCPDRARPQARPCPSALLSAELSASPPGLSCTGAVCPLPVPVSAPLHPSLSHSRLPRRASQLGSEAGGREAGHQMQSQGKVTDPDARPDPSAGDFLLAPRCLCPPGPGHRKGSDGHHRARNMHVGITGLGAPARGPLNVPRPRPRSTGGHHQEMPQDPCVKDANEASV